MFTLRRAVSRVEKRCASVARTSGLIAAIVIAPLLPPPVVHAQASLLQPAFRNLNGAAVWGSAGVPSQGPGAGASDDRTLWRGGFAVFYGPFGGRGDTLVTFTQSVTDSSDSSFCECTDGGGHPVRRHTRSSRDLRTDARRLGGGGKVTLLVGYQHSSSYRLGQPHFAGPMPVSGLFLATMLGPFPLPGGHERLEWYAGAGGTVVRLSGIVVRADTLALELSTERTLAPEALLMLLWRVTPGYRLYVGASYQYLRFGSIAYRPVQNGDRIPGASLATLPEQLGLRSLHLNVGLTFTASGLLRGS